VWGGHFHFAQALPGGRSLRALPCGATMPYSALYHPTSEIMTTDDLTIPRAMATRKGDEGGTGLGVATRTRTRTKKPSPYKVLMLNDDYTPMEFVVLCLQRFFRMGIEDATRVMLHVHQKGVGVCGVFSYEVAETKVSQVIDFARQNQHPLQCTLEKA
jgi:ATP-dependent Clp protease adaptor protein ClpS